MSKYHNAFQGFVKVFTGAAKPGVKGNPTTIIGVAPCLLYTSPSPRDGLLSRMPSSA